MEINPQTIVTSDDPINSYYCNHIYYPYYYQQTFGEMQCLRAFCDTSVVWYGEDFYNFCFLPTVTKSINVTEGGEYVQIYLGYVPPTSETGSCFDCTEYFVTTDNLFLQPDGECTYIKFNETRPTDTAFVKIIVTDYFDEVYTFNVFVVNPVFTLTDYTSNLNLQKNKETTLEVCASPQFGYSLNLPDTTKYNVEIITGSELSQLVNNTTSDSGQVLNDLPHSYGCLDQIILRTNDQIQADDEIKILISTSDPSIEPIEITFTNLLVVNIVPETISPGDTAQIIPKLKNPDGSLRDFPIEQTFEIGMLDGCALGVIKTATDSGVYVDAALQPFYFIADTGAVEGNVKLRVGVIEGMSSSSLLNNNFKSRKSEYQIKKSSASDNHGEAQSFIDGGVVGEYCFLGDLYSVVTGDADVAVGNECEDYPCDQGFVYSPPSIVSKLDDIIWSNTFTNEHGTKVFSGQKGGETFILFDDKFYVNQYPIKDELIQTFQIEPCFKNNKWQFLVTTAGDNNEIKLKVYVALYDWGYPNDIDNINELNIIPEYENCDALKDFEKHRPYRFTENYPGYEPPPSINKYFIKDATINHEKTHVKFFQLDIKDALKIKTKHYGVLKTFKEHLKFTPNCTSIFNNKDNARFQATKYYNILLKEFVKKLQIVNKSRFPDHRTKENKTQWNDDVQSTIDYYQRELRTFWKNQGKPIRNCDLKEFDWSEYTQYKNKF